MSATYTAAKSINQILIPTFVATGVQVLLLLAAIRVPCMAVVPSILALLPVYLSLLVGKMERSNISHYADLHTIIQDIIYLDQCTSAAEKAGKPTAYTTCDRRGKP